jgi:adenylate cyclase
MHQMLSQVTQRLARLPHGLMRWGLIGLLAMWATLRILIMNSADGNGATYDQMVKHRLWAPPADQSIVVVDIDEASLDSMKAEFGRWPWPRDTLAGVLDWLVQQQSQAVIFDILFADRDVLNPASDQVFMASVDASRQSYFPVLRLNPQNDTLSQLTADRLPGFASALTTPSRAAPTIAILPPVFEGIVQSGRIGFHNIYADADGVNRHYLLWEDVSDWRLKSLPLRLAEKFQWPLPTEARQLIQYTRTSRDYTRIPFSEVWRLSQTQAGQKLDARFQNAIVLIGATATNLFDVKVTPLNINHPGVFILANVVDNLKNQRFLRELSPLIQWILSLVLLICMGLASQHLNDEQMKWSMLLVPSLLLSISFASLHVGLDWFIDLEPSASHALLFFSVFSAYQTWRVRLLGSLKMTLQNLEIPKARTQVCNVLVVKLPDEQQEFHAVLDALNSWSGDARAMALGNLYQFFHLQPGLCYLQLWSESEDLAPLHSWMSMHRELWKLHFHRIRSDSQIPMDMTNVWEDVSLAIQQWSTKDDKV